MSGIQLTPSNVGTHRFGASMGMWATQQMVHALQAGKPMGPQALRTLETLRIDEWKFFDEALIEEGAIRLRGIADLIERGLVLNVPGAMGKTQVTYENVTDMDPAVTSLDGIARGDLDRQLFGSASIPLPITHKDFNISLRTLEASRTRGEPLDTTEARTAGRLVAERLEFMLFRGGGTYVGLPIYGYTTHPNRNTAGFGVATWSNGAVTGANILTDLHTGMSALEADRFYGEYMLYVPSGYRNKLNEDYKANSDLTIRERLLQTDGLLGITVCDQLPADNVILVQMSVDVTAYVDGEPVQTIQWDLSGGMNIAFKAMTIGVPLIRATAAGRSGVFHMS